MICLNTLYVDILGLDCDICLITSTGTLIKQAATSPRLAAIIWDTVGFNLCTFSYCDSFSLVMSYVVKKRADVGAPP